MKDLFNKKIKVGDLITYPAHSIGNTLPIVKVVKIYSNSLDIKKVNGKTYTVYNIKNLIKLSKKQIKTLSAEQIPA